MPLHRMVIASVTPALCAPTMGSPLSVVCTWQPYGAADVCRAHRWVRAVFPSSPGFGRHHSSNPSHLWIASTCRISPTSLAQSAVQGLRVSFAICCKPSPNPGKRKRGKFAARALLEQSTFGPTSSVVSPIVASTANSTAVSAALRNPHPGCSPALRAKKFSPRQTAQRGWPRG